MTKFCGSHYDDTYSTQKKNDNHCFFMEHKRVEHRSSVRPHEGLHVADMLDVHLWMVRYSLISSVNWGSL